MNLTKIHILTLQSNELRYIVTMYRVYYKTKFDIPREVYYTLVLFIVVKYNRYNLQVSSLYVVH